MVDIHNQPLFEEFHHVSWDMFIVIKVSKISQPLGNPTCLEE